jgi:hypothetical protein
MVALCTTVLWELVSFTRGVIAPLPSSRSLPVASALSLSSTSSSASPLPMSALMMLVLVLPLTLLAVFALGSGVAERKWLFRVGDRYYPSTVWVKR